MSSDPISEMVGGDGMMMVIVGLVCLIALLPGGWTLIFRAIGALISGVFLGLFAFLGWLLWKTWTRPRLQKRMVAEEAATRKYWGASFRERSRPRVVMPARESSNQPSHAPARHGDPTVSTWSSDDGQFLESLGFDRYGRRKGEQK